MNAVSRKFIMSLKYLLLPLSFLWETIYRIRRFCYNYNIFSQNKFEVPIISVGNLTFGGTGKTPFTLWLSQHFDRCGKKVMVLARGHKGRLEHGRGILRAGRLEHNPLDYGDETLALIRRCQNAAIVVGKKRSENLEHYFDGEQPDVVILDDGHQHLKLQRNLNIVLFDLLMPLASYRVAPMGYMREGFSALYDADIIILGKTNQVNHQKVQKLKNMLRPHVKKTALFAEIYHKPTALINCVTSKRFPCSTLAKRKVVCVAGIASPKAFFLTIETLKAQILETLSFPDHHHFETAEVKKILELAQKHDAIVVTTEKDMVKLRRIVSDEKIHYLEIEVDFLNGKDKLIELVDRAVVPR